MKIDWARKLTSRKFWMAAIAFITSLILIFGGSQEQATQIAGVILQGATLLAYCIGEGFADGKAAESGEIVIPPAESYDQPPDPKDDKYWD